MILFWLKNIWNSSRHILDSNVCVLKGYISSSSSGTSKAEERIAKDTFAPS